jgi:hypothetical protein
MVPVVVEDPSLTQQVIVSFCMRERTQNGKFGKIQVNIQQKIYDTLNIIFCLVIKAQKDSPFHTNAVTVVAFNTLPDIIRGVIHSLVDIPGTRLRRKVQDLGIIFNGMAYPFLFNGSSPGIAAFPIPYSVPGNCLQ